MKTLRAGLRTREIYLTGNPCGEETGRFGKVNILVAGNHFAQYESRNRLTTKADTRRAPKVKVFERRDGSTFDSGAR